jgi:sulfate adenylyltransferase subunit 1
MINSKIELLRFSTAGSVDDGKSTLIGRLLYDTKSIFKDQLDNIEKTSSSKGFDFVDLSLFTDGLKSEREQGITIDVAYRYFSTPRRKFIIADTPGHLQYTRNMVTGASNSNLSIILIDARKGILEQTKRHAFISSLLGIPHAIVCVNKMDLVDYNKDVFDEIVSSFKEFSTKLSIKDIKFIPISALIGDNVVERSQKMDWYEGSTLLYHLETVHISSDYNHVDCRFPVQMVVRPKLKKYLDFRGFAGRVDGGVFKPGDKVKVLPSGFTSEINNIQLNGETISEAFFPMSVTITLKDEIDIDRGDMIVRINNTPKSNQLIDVIITWMSNFDLRLRSKVLIKHTTNHCVGLIKELKYKIDINSLHRIEGISTLSMNEIGRASIQTSKPLFYDSYKDNRFTGSIILIDENTNETLGAGMII